MILFSYYIELLHFMACERFASIHKSGRICLRVGNRHETMENRIML